MSDENDLSAEELATMWDEGTPVEVGGRVHLANAAWAVEPAQNSSVTDTRRRVTTPEWVTDGDPLLQATG